MNKSWPYWVKGALLFAVLFIPLFWAEAVVWLFVPLAAVWGMLGVGYIFGTVYFLMGGRDPFGGLGNFSTQDKYIGLCAIIVFYIGVGAIVGWIYGKINRGPLAKTLPGVGATIRWIHGKIKNRRQNKVNGNTF